MHVLHHAHRITRLVLAWFALSLGVAIATPLVHAAGMQLVCTASGAVKLAAGPGAGKAGILNHTLDCPLCAAVGAPPPVTVAGTVAALSPELRLAAPGTAQRIPVRASPPPARGPPGRA